MLPTRFFVLSIVFSLAIAVPAALGQTADPDEQIVKSAGLATDDNALLQFFRLRSPTEETPATLEAVVQKLDAADLDVRRDALALILMRGPIALPLLKASLTGKPTLEMKRRVEEAIQRIEANTPDDTAAATARLLARRNVPGALEVLLRYVTQIDDPWLEEEVLASIGRLGIQDGIVDVRLLDALKDPLPARRAAALYVLGRRGEVLQRDAIRAALGDPSPLVRERAVQGLVGKRATQAVVDNTAADDAILKANLVPVTEQGLLDFFRKRTLDESDQARLLKLVKDLGSSSYPERHAAAQLLVNEGTSALGFLKIAEVDPDAEVSRRARRCLEEIRRGPGPALPIAAVRVLVRSGLLKEPGAAIRVLLSYVPFADDETVEDEVLASLTLLNLRQRQVDPAITGAVADPSPARRGAAAYVLGHVGTQEQLPPLRKLLDDPLASVRWRSAQGLLAAREKAAVPTLIALLKEERPAVRWKLEEILGRLAGEQAPSTSLVDVEPAARLKAIKNWEAWWLKNEATLHLNRAFENENFLGLVTVVEYDTVNGGQLTGQVWEAPRNGARRWTIGNLVGAMDAHVLPNGRVLVAENSANRVTERDQAGNIHWEYVITGGNPIGCQRLANGNTFIATYNQLIEVRPDKTEVYRYSPGPQFYIFSAQKSRAGTVVCMTAQGTLLEIDPVRQKQVRTINLGFPAGGWCSVEALPGGRYLVATMNNNTVREIDTEGKTHWSATFPGVFRATRLPNGNVLVVSMSTRKVAELDRAGTERWSRICAGRPWNVHYR